MTSRSPQIHSAGAALLELDAVNTHYGPLHILQDVSLTVNPGEVVALLGGNASGKSTTLKTILGLVRPTSGAIRLNGEDVSALPISERIMRGVAVTPENRRVFGALSVRENLLVGAHLRRDRAGIAADLVELFERFPRLGERQGQPAGTLSGGEQQVLAVARALISRPRLLLMDEPSMGLAPRLVEQNLALIAAIARRGVAILMVEQHATQALRIAQRGYVLQTGRVALHDHAAALLGNPALQQAYL